jgi:hypothetical protein
LVGIEFLFVLRLFSFESRFSFMVLTKLCMLKCRHLRVRVRAPRATVMRRREALPLLPPSATTSSGPSSFASRNVGSVGGEDREEEEEGQGDDEEREEMSSLPLHQRTLGRKIQGRNPRGEGGLDRQLVC